MTVHGCDERLDPRGPWTFEPWEAVTLPHEMAGGGGTSFVPVFDWIAGRGLRPDLLVYFTDAEGQFPQRAPDYPVIWFVKGRGRIPWASGYSSTRAKGGRRKLASRIARYQSPITNHESRWSCSLGAAPSVRRNGLRSFSSSR